MNFAAAGQARGCACLNNMQRYARPARRFHGAKPRYCTDRHNAVHEKMDDWRVFYKDSSDLQAKLQATWHIVLLFFMGGFISSVLLRVALTFA